MKATLRIATKDPYCYIEAECEGNEHEIVEAYGALYRAYNARYGTGLPPKDFDALIQNQMSGEGNHIDLVEKMSEDQRRHYDINKRAMSRINYKLSKQTD